MDTTILASLLDALPDHDTEVRLRRQLCAEAARDAYQRGYREGYERGARLREADAVKPGPNEPSFAELELLRYGPGGREHFGAPRDGDGRAGRTPRDARASGLIPAGKVLLGGRLAHGGHWDHGLDCTAACRAYEPGWYTYAAAARIMATLPDCPSYRRETARLRRLAGYPAAAATAERSAAA